MTTDEKNTRSGALDVDLDAPLTQPAGYFEDKDFRPDPMAMYGTLETSDTGGGAHQDIRETSPVFTEARAHNLQTAARALDPTDRSVPSELVTLPEGAVTVQGTSRTVEEAREELETAYKEMVENPVGIGGAGPNAQAAGEVNTDADDAMKNEAEGGERQPGATPQPNSSVGSTDTSKAAARRSGATQK